MPDARDPLDPLRNLPDSAPDPDFVDRLEAGLRVAHADAAPRSSSPSSTGRRLGLLVPVLVVLVVVASTTLVLRDGGTSAALELSDAVNVEVTLPDGTRVVDPDDGFELVDGAVVTIGAGGSATVDDVLLGADTIVTVRDGALVTDVVGTTTSRPPADDQTAAPDPTVDPQPTVDPPATSEGEVPPDTRPPDGDPGPDPGPVDTTPSPTRPPSPTSDPPATTASPPPSDSVARPSDTSTPPSLPPVEPTPTVRPDDGVDLALRLRVRARDGGVALTWSVEGIGDQPWRTLVLRRAGAEPPTWPLSAGTVVVAESAGGGPGEHVDLPTQLTAGPVRYRIVVVDDRDGLVAAGAVQTLARR